MKLPSPPVLMVVIPVVVMLLLGGLIFGGQAISDNSVDAEIRQALAMELDTSDEVELEHLQKVRYGYGVCGLYKTPSSTSGFASFFYDTASGRVTLDINSRRYAANCGLSALCN